MPAGKADPRIEFGDFQTPDELALQACRQLSKLGVAPSTIIEPTCGAGSFVRAALKTFTRAKKVFGVEINERYAAQARQSIGPRSKARIIQGDCFNINWNDFASEWRPLVLGNPPWVTSATIGSIGGTNVPEKSNFQDRKGLDAITGKANFDISEWMLLRAVDWLAPRDGQLAMLVKTSVARKVLLQCWRKRLPMEKAALWDIDAKEHFGASVSACFLFISFLSGASSRRCDHYSGLGAARPDSTFCEVEGLLVADIDTFEKWKHLRGSKNPHFVWRSGVKHDCSSVMELSKDGGKLINGLGEAVKLERRYLFPMLKSSHVARGTTEAGRFMIVTQTRVGEETASIARHAPKTWAYLNSHRDKLDARRSSIYRGKPPFSIFGIGPYSFAPWKIAISGLYKKLTFTTLPPVSGAPVMPDDTVYFLPCRTAEEAEYISKLLNSEPAREFLTSLIFWSEKRPVSTDILRSLSLPALAKELGSLRTYNRLVSTSNDLPLFAAAG